MTSRCALMPTFRWGRCGRSTPSDGPRPTYVADLKGASSVAHVYGKVVDRQRGVHLLRQAVDVVADRPSSTSPTCSSRSGVTRFCIHTSAHQPLAAPPPGIALAPFLGQSFTVNETWSGMARPWIDYLARCSAVLSAGTPAVDFAVFVGEEAPVTGALPRRDGHVRAGRLRLRLRRRRRAGRRAPRRGRRARLARVPATALLYLGGSIAPDDPRPLSRRSNDSWMPGPPSSASARSPRRRSRTTLPCSRRCATASGRPGASVASSRRISQSALEKLGCDPRWRWRADPSAGSRDVVDGRRITFLANPTAETVRTPSSARPACAESGRLGPGRGAARSSRPGRIRRIGSLRVCRDAPGVRLALRARRSDPASPMRRTHRTALRGDWHVQLPGSAPLAMTPSVLGSGPSSAPPGEASRARASIGTTSQLTETDGRPRPRSDSSSSSVGDIARVLAQRAGLRDRVDAALPRRHLVGGCGPGGNSLEIHVATPWRNRLIAEAAASSGEIFAPMTEVYEPTAEPLPAGLDGTVFRPVRASDRRPWRARRRISTPYCRT